jgi:hypothetical protein
MKTKLSLFIGAIAVVLTLGLGSVALAQMGGYGGGQKNNTSSTAAGSKAADAGKAKPGTKMPDGTIVATPITPEEAAKKYPMPNGKSYPTGDRPTSHYPGHVLSPYPPHQEFLCGDIPKGGLVLDTKVNKVFVRP